MNNFQFKPHPLAIFQKNIVVFREDLTLLKKIFERKIFEEIVLNEEENKKTYANLVEDFVNAKTKIMDLYSFIDLQKVFELPKVFFEKFLTAKEIFNLLVTVDECLLFLRERNCNFQL